MRWEKVNENFWKVPTHYPLSANLWSGKRKVDSKVSFKGHLMPSTKKKVKFLPLMFIYFSNTFWGKLCLNLFQMLIASSDSWYYEHAYNCQIRNKTCLIHKHKKIMVRMF